MPHVPFTHQLLSSCQQKTASQAVIDRFWMRFALQQARLAAQQGEVPVGAVLVQHGRLLSAGYNQPISQCNPIAHAEIMVLQRGAAVLQNYRLLHCTLYVTLEPCTMCAGALVHSRIQRLVYAASEPKSGAIKSKNQLLQADYMNHQVAVTGGVLADESSLLLQAFFQQRRDARKQLKQNNKNNSDSV
ncbi:tRNA adenosine(34) deaminase TadA [Zooshikella harenae]|uniref:tRNA-specific adenosine deaminase n=1 Tax=Zooshikella harenae TaxID=2827238 RepID=A0ABS5ZHZ2_9GAMM|nr:tRNA adenosine(34) deaminase TadA [Zooshikella harenae]MBU2712906.1 tRNA adenosine(34) deaminase TadA [Zooshikella harenae]